MATSRKARGEPPLRLIQIGRSISPRSRRLAQFGDKIERPPFSSTPAGALPAGPDHEVCAGFDHGRHAVRLQIGPIAKTDLARDDRYPVERLTVLLIGQFEVAKAFLRKIERAVNAPQLVVVLRASVPSSARWWRR